MLKIMDVSLNGLQRNLIEDYQRLVKMLNKAIKPGEDYIKINGDSLERVVGDLHNSIVTVACLIDPDTGKSFLDGDAPPLLMFEMEPES